MAGGGEKRVVVVDDLIPVTVNGQALFTTARDGACLAFSLIEKALAKHYGSFAVLNGGNTSEALWDLTGCAVEDVKLDGEQKLSAQQCAALVGDAIKRGDLVSCGHIDVKKRGDSAAVCEGGVRMNHAFAVVGASAKEAKGYNPMGYDDGYSNGKTDGEGTLTMSWSEFIRSFPRLQICHLSSRRALPFRKSWATSGAAVLAWSAGRSAGGCTNFSTFRRNPMLRRLRGVEANRKATIEVGVGQHDRRGGTGGRPRIRAGARGTPARRPCEALAAHGANELRDDALGPAANGEPLAAAKGAGGNAAGEAAVEVLHLGRRAHRPRSARAIRPRPRRPRPRLRLEVLAVAVCGEARARVVRRASGWRGGAVAAAAHAWRR